MQKYKYKVKGADPINNTLTVEYTPESASLDVVVLGLPGPSVSAPLISDTDFKIYINKYAPFDRWDIQSNPNPTIGSYIGREGDIIDPSLYVEVVKDPYQKLKEEYDKMEQDFLNEENV